MDVFTKRHHTCKNRRVDENGIAVQVVRVGTRVAGNGLKKLDQICQELFLNTLTEKYYTA
jgi:phosphoribosylformylglycinamidine (FGAM) synthase PurS component